MADICFLTAPGAGHPRWWCGWGWFSQGLAPWLADKDFLWVLTCPSSVCTLPGVSFCVNFLFLHGQESHWIRAQLKGLNFFIYLFKNSVCRYSHILSPCRLALPHISLGGHNPVLQSLSRSSPSQDCIHIYTLFLRFMVSNFILNASWNLFWYVSQILLRNRLYKEKLVGNIST